MSQTSPGEERIHGDGSITHGTPRPPTGRYLALLSLATLGVVYGDIGTSPIHAFRESFHPDHEVAPSPANVLGVLSLIFWALVVIISIKYLVFILRADNRGEGGILALTALVTPVGVLRRSGKWFVIMLGRETLIAVRDRVGMPLWRDRLFAYMARNARPATSFFRLPTAQVVELGAQIEI
jgi:K+ transporter